MIVVDASVVIDLLLGEPVATAALARQIESREHQPLHAPEIVEPETLNALRRLARGGHVSDRRAGEAAGDLARLRLVRYPHAPLRGRVWELRDRLTAYDACYLALTEALGEGAVLMTRDRALARVSRKAIGAGGAQLVA